jgi:hypothetical protein
LGWQIGLGKLGSKPATVTGSKSSTQDPETRKPARKSVTPPPPPPPPPSSSTSTDKVQVAARPPTAEERDPLEIETSSFAEPPQDKTPQAASTPIVPGENRTGILKKKTTDQKTVVMPPSLTQYGEDKYKVIYHLVLFSKYCSFLYSDHTSESEDGLLDLIDGSEEKMKASGQEGHTGRSHHRRMELKLEHSSHRERSRSPRRRSGVDRRVDFAAEDLSSLPSRSTLPKGALKS